MIIPMLPFAQDQGLKLPARLKALEMIGHSADRFNFGWLSATPRLERLQILGIRTKGQIGLIESESQTSPWHWRAVVLLYLKEMVVHHSPARHFMFEIVQQCPRLEVLDVRGVRWTAFQTFNDHSPVIIETGMQSRYSEISSARGKEYLTCCRMEITPGAQELSAPKMFSGLKHVFHTYFSNVVKLRVDGVPARIVIDATGGASWASCDGDTVTRMMRRLERVVVKDSIGIVEYGMVPVPRTGSREGAATGADPGDKEDDGKGHKDVFESTGMDVDYSKKKKKSEDEGYDLIRQRTVYQNGSYDLTRITPTTTSPSYAAISIAVHILTLMIV
ncbi:hypothetical protein BC939DRAFT_482363 [Gamsiella multidivaricata]|uniref:uncharacterized protein n=1 Tax=Gamsiella multidivaricata TaxID=101098 RepID=UPI002220DCC4|nr:uncharacterized protein BC939DRAFT_482363 [Gamsiella multidivaricata]KAI7816035.1 hypothetical protein BC939DRAFT_482363 [Gamsiella multidivaricata]